MLLTHRFDSVQTLTRARFWLTTLGFEVAKCDTSRPDRPALSMVLDYPRATAARALIDSIEHSDPAAWPEIDREWGLAMDSVAGPAAKPTPIAWHSHEGHSADEAISCKVCEYMLSR